jgi:AcrR family transcriptional regulator
MATPTTSTGSPGPEARRGRPRAVNARSDVRAAATVLFADQGYRSTGVRDIADALGIGPTSVYTHIRSKAELLREIVIDTLDALLAIQQEAIASTLNVVEQLRRAAESQVRFFVQHPNESLVAIREFRWAEGDDLREIQARRHAYRRAFEDLLTEGDRQQVLTVENAKIAAFSIIEMAEAVPTWFRPDREVSENQLAYLYGEYALRIAGATAEHSRSTKRVTPKAR